MHQLRFNHAKPIVFFHISGPRQTREPLVQLAIDTTRLLNDTQVVISAGLPNGSIQPRALNGNAWYYEWCPARDEIFAMSDAIMMRGGHTAITQAMQFGKPIVTIPIENHGEQLGNSAKIAELGAGIMLSPKEILPSKLAMAMREILENPSYSSKAVEIMKASEQFNGVENVIRILSKYSVR